MAEDLEEYARDLGATYASPYLERLCAKSIKQH